MTIQDSPVDKFHACLRKELCVSTETVDGIFPVLMTIRAEVNDKPVVLGNALPVHVDDVVDVGRITPTRLASRMLCSQPIPEAFDGSA